MPQSNSDRLTAKYERLHLQAQKKRAKEIERLFKKAIDEAVTVAALVRIEEGAIFELAKHPALQKTIDLIVAKTQAQITVIIQNGITDSWDLSNVKNDAIFGHRIDRKLIPPDVHAKYYNPNKEALEVFKSRSLKTSIRVWKPDQFAIELEKSLGEGIATGKSATRMATDAKRFLKEPDKLFRRVRNAEGKLKLSRAAKAYNPGQGVYRSSYKNALRLTGTETNRAYRRADNERYKNAPDVIGFQVNLSNNHSKFDICDALARVYPVEFVYEAWHPHCRCFVTPVMSSEKEFNEYLEALGNGEPYTFKSKVKEMPAEFNTWVADNKERILKAKNEPYFIRDNSRFVSDLLK